MLDDKDGDVRNAPVSDETHEIGDRGIEVVRAYDGDRKDPNILEQSQMLRPAVSADQATYTAAVTTVNTCLGTSTSLGIRT